MLVSLNMIIIIKKRFLQLHRVLFVSRGGIKARDIIFHLGLFSLHGFDRSRVTAVLASGQGIMNPKVSKHLRKEIKRLQSAGDLEGFP